MKVTDLARGFLFDYDLKTWEIEEEYEYDWGEKFYTKEYKISSGRESRYLSVEVDDEVELAIWDKITLPAIDRNLASHIMNHDEPPREISLSGRSYFRKEESLGYWRNTKSSNWQKFINWDFETADGNDFISVERWGEEEFEASKGQKVKEFEISNILPRESGSERAPRDYKERKKKSFKFSWLILIGLAFLIFGTSKCRSALFSGSSSSSVSKNAIDDLITSYYDNDQFSIVLYDMQNQSSGWSRDYFHKYLVIATKDSLSEPQQTQTEWMEVTKDFYQKNEDNLGMELVSKNGTDLTKGVSPPGWGSYVGNEKYNKIEKIIHVLIKNREFPSGFFYIISGLKYKPVNKKNKYWNYH